MRLIISPLAPPPVAHPSSLGRGGPSVKRRKSLQILQDRPTVFQPLPLLTLKTIIREDKYARLMHSYRKIALYSGNGCRNPFRSVIRPADRGEAWSSGSDQTTGAREPCGGLAS